MVLCACLAIDVTRLHQVSGTMAIDATCSPTTASHSFSSGTAATALAPESTSSTVAAPPTLYRSLDRNEFSVDHSIEGLVVVPFVQAVVIMLDFVAFCHPRRKIIGIRDAKLFKGLIFREQVINVRLTAKLVGGDAEQIKCELHIEAPAASKIRWQPSYAAVFRLGDSHPPLPAALAPPPQISAHMSGLAAKWL